VSVDKRSPSEKDIDASVSDLRARVKELEKQIEDSPSEDLKRAEMAMSIVKSRNQEIADLRAKLAEVEKERDAYAAAAHVYFDDKEDPKDATIERYKKAFNKVAAKGAKK